MENFEQRKIVKQGKSALTITLPSKWCKKYSLDENSSIYIKEEQDKLIIKSNQILETKKINLDITNSKRGLAYHQITGIYIQGYDLIEIKHNNFKLAQEISNAFLGLIAEEISQNKLILKNIIKTPEDNFFEIFKISTQHLIELARSLNTCNYNEIKTKEKILDKNLFYSLRYISKYEKIEDSYKYFLLCSTIESVGDTISEISSYMQENKISKKQIEKIIHIIEYYVVYLFENNLEKLFTHLKTHKKNNPKKDYIDALTLSISENLYNFVGYLKKN